MNIYLILALAILLNAGANIMIKAAVRVSPIIIGQGSIVEALLQAVRNPRLIAGVVLFALALAAYSIVLSKINLSVAYPIMTGAGFLVVFLVSALFFKEAITSVHLFGSALILAGVWFLAR